VIDHNREIQLAYSPVLYTVSGKKRPQYFGHNFDKFRHNIVIFGMNHPDTSMNY